MYLRFAVPGGTLLPVGFGFRNGCGRNPRKWKSSDKLVDLFDTFMIRLRILLAGIVLVMLLHGPSGFAQTAATPTIPSPGSVATERVCDRCVRAHENFLASDVMQ